MIHVYIFSSSPSIELPLVYRPRHRLKPVPPIPIPFPLIPTRDDWPLERETIGGWSLTPFGGRGRWNHSEAVEVEGLLGIACPLALVAGSKLRISLLLWGTSSAWALLSPDAVRLRLVRAHVMGLDALSPSSRAHTSRIVFEEERWDGVVWAHGERERVIARKDSGSEVDSGVGLPDDHPRLVEYTTQAPDPPEEDEDEFPGTDEVGSTIKLHGSVHVPHDAVPSFRYKNMAVEYLVQVIVSHRDYNHVSPNGPGIVGEAPVWVVGPAPEQVQGLDSCRERSKKRMVGRSIVPLPKDVKRMPVVQGSVVQSEQS
ncbi:hypothetical protein RSOLAG22IIIB_08792 [Rhizoctonia solani]|uniref:Arrestin-like N-terminal domain-containing protein n=1 Tax=Rhizoctonia solani TaxID=456999 RepID=A0A0K6FV20_9AGAM|nr:hypothetical protein RSOLAG22IIIB_08792 [Rhizoctonia solani]